MEPIDQLFEEEIKVINMGIPSFRDELADQDVPVVHVDWRPPAGGNEKVQSLLSDIKSSQA